VDDFCKDIQTSLQKSGVLDKRTQPFEFLLVKKDPIKYLREDGVINMICLLSDIETLKM